MVDIRIARELLNAKIGKIMSLGKIDQIENSINTDGTIKASIEKDNAGLAKDGTVAGVGTKVDDVKDTLGIKIDSLGIPLQEGALTGIEQYINDMQRGVVISDSVIINQTITIPAGAPRTVKGDDILPSELGIDAKKKYSVEVENPSLESDIEVQLYNKDNLGSDWRYFNLGSPITVQKSTVDDVRATWITVQDFLRGSGGAISIKNLSTITSDLSVRLKLREAI